MLQLEKDLQGVALLQIYDRIADICMEQVIPIVLQIEKLYQPNEQLTQTRDVLLPQLMNGEISV